MTSPKIVRAILAYGAVIILFSAFVALLKVQIDASVRDVVMVIIGAFITMAKDAVGYFYATSQSSADKNVLLADRPLDLTGAEVRE